MADDKFEDLETCAKEGRIPLSNKPLRIKVDEKKLIFKKSVTFGKDILKTAEKEPVEDYLLYQILSDGMLEEIRLEETVDLRRKGIEKFLSFKSDRSFRFELDGRRFDWGASCISGRKLKDLAQVDSNQYGVWLEVSGKEDRPVNDKDFVDLQGEGLERFYTGIKETTPGNEGFSLPLKDRNYLNKKKICFDTASENDSKGVILKNFSLPDDKFNLKEADVLIILPPGYPDCAPDMFYTQPWLKLSETNNYAQATDQSYQFSGHSWQRWSRHNSSWRSGVDGIWTMLQRVKDALENAQ